jgi:hypothetical protein
LCRENNSEITSDYSPLIFRYSDLEREEIRQRQEVFLIPPLLEDIAGYEQTLVDALQSEIPVGDRVTVIGGGEGVTALVAAQAVGETGFEGSGWGLRKVKYTGMRNNGVETSNGQTCRGGPGDQRYGDPGQTLVVALSETGLRGAEIYLARYDYSSSEGKSKSGAAA